LGKQGYKILDEENVEIFMKSLVIGYTARCLFYRSDDKMNVKVNWPDFTIGNKFFITDVWLHIEVGTTAAPFIATIAKHYVILLRLHKK